MQKKFNLNHQYFKYAIILLLFILVSCNGGSNPNHSGKQLLQNKSKISIKANIDSMSIDWTVDNTSPDDINTTLKDMGWHLITITVSSVDKTIKPIPVEGLLATIYPEPSVNVGQQIQIKDINCESAVFSKVGDSCSAYFKLSYDTSKGTDNQVMFSVQMAPKGNIAGVLSFSSAVKPFESIANYRAVNPIENKYYSGTNIATNKNSYQILLIQNASLQPINITKLSALTNQIFTLIHRSMASGNNDPYYGNESECSLSANPSNGQVNTLTNLYDSCITVYKAPETSSSEQETERIEIATDARYFYPSWSNKYNLIAQYINGAPLPAQAISQTDGSFFEPLPVKNFTITYNFTPEKLSIYKGSIQKRIILNNSDRLFKDDMILTNIGPASIASFEQEFPVGKLLGKDNVSVNACGGAYAYADVTAKAFVNGRIEFDFDIQSNAHCANGDRAIFNYLTSEDGYFNMQVYALNDRGCGNPGDNWDIGAYTTLTGVCSENWCNYIVLVRAHHGGAPGQCQDTQDRSFELSFAKPNSHWILQLNSTSEAPINFAAQGGQYSEGKINGLPTQINQAPITCNNDGMCTAVDIHTSNTTGRDISYMLQLNRVHGSTFNNGIIQFERSSGYDLSSFNLRINNQ